MRSISTAIRETVVYRTSNGTDRSEGLDEMTATLDLTELDFDSLAQQPCECRRDCHHVNHAKCDQEPLYATRVRHAANCTDDVAVMLCQDCLDEAMQWASSCVGMCCDGCFYAVRAASDLVGPVITLR